MQDILTVLSALMPEYEEELIQRLDLLRLLSQQNKRLGRRHLAELLHTTERPLRTILQALKATGIVDINSRGVMLTERGLEVLNHAEYLMYEAQRRPFYQAEQGLRDRLGIPNCVIVPSKGLDEARVFEAMGQATEEVLLNHLHAAKAVIAVTGGATLSHISHGFSKRLSEGRQVTFVPTRGGLSASVEIQSTSVGSMMAQATGGDYVPLYMPENIDLATSEKLLEEPSIAQVLDQGKHADCLLLSVGTAEVMAERRNLNPSQRAEICEQGAVGEAFGTFFDKQGQVVLKYPRVGMQLEDLANIPLVTTIVAGSDKAEAIKAFAQLSPRLDWLICDESLAETVLNGVTLLK